MAPQKLDGPLLGAEYRPGRMESWRSTLPASMCALTTGMKIQMSRNGSGGVLFMHVEEHVRLDYWNEDIDEQEW